MLTSTSWYLLRIFFFGPHLIKKKIVKNITKKDRKNYLKIVKVTPKPKKLIQSVVNGHINP